MSNICMQFLIMFVTAVTVLVSVECVFERFKIRKYFLKKCNIFSKIMENLKFLALNKFFQTEISFELSVFAPANVYEDKENLGLRKRIFFWYRINSAEYRLLKIFSCWDSRAIYWDSR